MLYFAFIKVKVKKICTLLKKLLIILATFHIHKCKLTAKKNNFELFMRELTLIRFLAPQKGSKTVNI